MKKKNSVFILFLLENNFYEKQLIYFMLDSHGFISIGILCTFKLNNSYELLKY